MISICMATYNGEKYIKEQLDCIYKQTVQPDEVIICDDGSRDGTVKQIQAFIEEYDLQDKWKLICNPVQKGYPGNFYYCMSLAQGDIVFLADQDDVWSLQKLEKMTAIMEREAEMQILACKMELVDAEGNDIKTIIKPNYSTETEQTDKVTLEKVLYKNEWSGMVLAYRNSWYREHMAKIQNTKLPHDLAICIMAAAEGKMYQLDSILAWHRRHDNNAAGEEHRISKLLDKERKIADIEKYAGYLEVVLHQDIIEDTQNQAILEKKYLQMQTRAELLRQGKCLPVLKNYLKNREEVRLFTFLCDFLICLKE